MKFVWFTDHTAKILFWRERTSQWVFLPQQFIMQSLVASLMVSCYEIVCTHKKYSQAFIKSFYKEIPKQLVKIRYFHYLQIAGVFVFIFYYISVLSGTRIVNER